MILVIGNNSIARSFSGYYAARCRLVEAPAVFNSGPDFSLPEILDSIPVEIVINCWEFGGPDRAEYEREDAYNINSFAAKELALCCGERNIFLVHISTSYVFNGKKEAPYTEDDSPDPVSFYGDSRLLGEIFIRESGCRHLIVRTGDIYGTDTLPCGLSFLRVKDSGIRVIRGQKIAPSSCDDLVAAAAALVEKKAEGLFHYSPSGTATPAEFLSACAGLLTGLPAEPRNWTEYDPCDFVSPAERPFQDVLDHSRLIGVTSLVMPGWRSALENFINKNHASFLPPSA